MTLRRWTVLLAAFSLALVGCGGGGGGSSTRAGAVLTYATDWGATPGAKSQKVLLQSADGTTIAERALSAGGPVSFTFSGVPTGTLRLHAELYSQPAGAGELLGTVDASIPSSGQVAVNTAVDAPISAIKVTPETATMRPGEVRQFDAAATTNTGVYVFTKRSDISWSATGPVTVDSNGLATAGATTGASSLTATHGPSGKSGSATIGVESDQVTRTKWTVLVYLNAANSLYPFALPNMNQMERVAGNANVRFVVQWKQVRGLGGNDRPLFSGTRRYLVQNDPQNSGALQSTVVQNLGDGVDMGDWRTLDQFLQWGMAKYPADRYVLVLWNHGSGWRTTLGLKPPTRAISYDDETGNKINIWQLPQALGGRRFDILSYDACFMQMIEVADELKANAQYLAGSQDLTPGPGYPYDRVFARMVANPDDSTANVARGFVEGMTQAPEYQSQEITQSVLDTSKVDAVVAAVDALGKALLTKEPNLSTLIPLVRSTSNKMGDPGDGYNYYDLSEIAGKIGASSSSPEVKSAATAVQAAVASAILWNGQLNSASSKGLAIDFSSNLPAPPDPRATYQNLRFAQESSWDEFLKIAP